MAEIEEVSDENTVSFAHREVFISKEMLALREWYFKKCAESNKDGCSCDNDACFNGGGLCSFNRAWDM